ncbi:hypothetical protein ACHAXA_006128 [Cyclostephanos tholiformis]|uniref:Ketopantoate reductase C-terminal domain-containing protein n=1 Tax=Cyclostephanos tholiformis TaxID=382380 RepID=A0ABD3RB16_9STRA
MAASYYRPSPPTQSTRRRAHHASPPLQPMIVSFLLLFLLHPPTSSSSSNAASAAATTTATKARTTIATTGTPLTLSFPIHPGPGECLYERMIRPGEHLTGSVLVTSGSDMKVVVKLEGPVAPVDLDLFHDDEDERLSRRDGSDMRGSLLMGYISRYDVEGFGMFVDGRFGDGMMNVRPIRVSDYVDFEEAMEEEEEEEEGGGGWGGGDRPPGRRRVPSGEEGIVEVDDAYLAREEANIEHLHREAEVDDDFVKLQIRNLKPAPVASATDVPDDGHRDGGDDSEGGEGRKIPPPPPRRKRNGGRRRRLTETIRPPAGEPYERTVVIESPGWYRLCANTAHDLVTAEMELRKESTHGKVDARTGHVPGLEEVEIHSEIRALYEEEEEEGEGQAQGKEGAGKGRAGMGDIEDEDLRVTREQLRILERVYSEIINKQLEERRKWNWRTIKNQHLYSHLVLGNLVETFVYMGITGWQVYTIRKWFGGGPKLGRVRGRPKSEGGCDDMIRAIIRPLRSAVVALAPSRWIGPPIGHRPPTPPPPRRSTTITSTATAALGRIDRMTSPPNYRTTSTSGIFPMHVLGCGPIGLLYASAMLDAYYSRRRRRRRGSNHHHRDHQDENDDEDDDDDDDDDAVTLILRSHHESRLRWSSSRRGDGSTSRFARVTVRRPPPPSSSSSSSSSGRSMSSSSAWDEYHRRTRRASAIGDVVSRHDVRAELTIRYDLDDDEHDRGNDRGGPIRCLLLCTKANDAIEALRGVWGRLLPSSSTSSSSSSSNRDDIAANDEKDDVARVIILSNGALSIRDAIYDRFVPRRRHPRDGGYDGATSGCRERSGTSSGGVRIVLGTTTHGAYRNRPTAGTRDHDDDDDDDVGDDDFVGHYDIVHAGIGSTVCADREFVDACTSIGWDASHVSSDAEMEAILWRKLAANCVINPLTAVHRIRNGDLLDAMTAGSSRLGDDDAIIIRTIAMGILEEVSAVATMEMVRHPSTVETLSVSSLEGYVMGVMSVTRDNVSSMLQDVEAGRSTEVRYLNGYVSTLGRERHGVECPLNTEMCRLVDELTSSSRKSSYY